MITYETMANNTYTINQSTHVMKNKSTDHDITMATDKDILESSASTITCHGISYTVGIKSGPCKKLKHKDILKDISGVFKPGMNAILGPTGSGKTSLLNVIAGRKDINGLSGTLLVDGHLLPDNFKCMTGYVVQDDVVMGTLSIRENLMFSANVRLPESIDQMEKARRVTSIMKELGLSHVADSKVGTDFLRGVSGGERKRTNIGMELIISPPVLFLDEPTTGLDASTANAVMLLLHRLSEKGRTIVFSIHQPRYSIFKLFDSLMLLSLGHVVYHGPAPSALSYFSNLGYECEEHNNPPDFFLDIINGDSTSLQTRVVPSLGIATEDHQMEHAADQDTPLADVLSQKYRESSWFQMVKTELETIEDEHLENVKSGREVKIHHGEYCTSFFTQLRHVGQRTILNILRNPRVSIAQLGVVLVFALIVGILYFQVGIMMPEAVQNRVGCLFFIIMNQVFSSLSSVELFIQERAMFIHENSSGFYRVSSFFCAKVLCDLIPLRAVPVIVFSCISYFMIGLRMDVMRFFFYMLNLFLTASAATTIGFFYSACFRIFAIANLMITLTFVLMMVFGGLFVNLKTMPAWLSWLQYLSIFRYSFNALAIIEMKDAIFCAERPDIISYPPEIILNATEPVCTEMGNKFLNDQGIAHDNAWDLWSNELALFLFGCGFLMLTWVKLLAIKKYK